MLNSVSQSQSGKEDSGPDLSNTIMEHVKMSHFFKLSRVIAKNNQQSSTEKNIFYLSFSDATGYNQIKIQTADK
jgi:hypothetical protein